MGTNADDWMAAADKLLAGLEAERAASREETDKIKAALERDIAAIAGHGVQAMQAARVGRSTVLVPNRENLSVADRTAQRARDRFSRFSAHWLDPDAAEAAIRAGEFDGIDVGTFVRHSRRLVRQARDFLTALGELEPTMQEEIDDTLAELADARNDIIKLEVRSWTTVRENMLRLTQGRASRTTASAQARSFDINANIWNLSLLAHPAAVGRSLLARASDRMGVRATPSRSPGATMLAVGVGPKAEAAMTPASRTADVAWRMMSQADLAKLNAKANADRTSASTWRGLGLAPNTSEVYVPVPPESAEDVAKMVRERRRALMERIAREGASAKP